MSRIGAIVTRLYSADIRPSVNVNKAEAVMNARPTRKEGKLAAFKKALGGRRTVVWAIRIVVVLVVLFLITACIVQFNRFARWHTMVEARWAGVDRELQRRENLIPNLVSAVGRYAAYEQGVFKYVSEVRSELKKIKSSGGLPDQINSMLEKTLSGLVALAEAYPDLKATNSVEDLIKEAANTEDRIADAKKEYNKACESYNRCLIVIPGKLLSNIYGFKASSYIGLGEDVEVPVMDLDMTGQQEGLEENAAVNKERELQ
jgi:LemA protein